MADKKSEMGLKDFVESGAFEPGSRAYEKVMQDEVDQAAERSKTIKDAKKAIKKIKFKEKMESGLGYARAVPGLGSLAGSIAGIAANVKSSDRLTQKDIESASGMKKGGSVMSRGCKMGRNKKTKIY
jgi:hypothetical protein